MKTIGYSPGKVKKKAGKDGRGWRWKFWPLVKAVHPVTPAADEEELPSFEREIMQAGEKALSRLYERWSNDEINLKKNYCNARVELSEAYEDLLKDEGKFDAARKEYDSAEDDFEALPQPAFSKAFEWSIIIVLAIAEFYLNYKIFNVMGSGKLETMIVAAGISLALPWSAFAFGHLIRLERRTLTQKLFLIALSGLALLVIFGIAFLRSAMFETDWELSGLEMHLSPAAVSISFIAINLMLWCVAAFVSYRAAHAKPVKYRTLKLRMKSARRRMRKEGAEHREAVNRYEKARRNFEQAKHKRKEVFDAYLAEAMDTIKEIKHYISIYRTVNLETRRDGKTPPCFKRKIPEVQLPDGFRGDTLDWNCDISESREFIETLNPN